MKRFTALSILAALLVVMGCHPVKAQFIGYTSPQTVTQSLSLSCVGGASAVLTAITNLGQSNHLVTFLAPNGASVTLIGGTGTLQVPISVTSVGRTGSATAFGYYNIVSVETSCTVSGTITLLYTGTSSAPGVLTGQADISSYDFLLGYNEPAATTVNLPQLFPPPYGSTGGVIYFTYTGAGPTGSTISVIGGGASSGSMPFVLTFTPVTTTAIVQTFQIPPIPAAAITVAYTTGGASASTYTLEYQFNKPGTTNLSAATPTHITGTTATAVKATSGVLTKIVVGTPAAGTITFFDLPAASCTGTPSTNVRSVITATSTAPLGSVTYDAFFNNGICVQASAAMDLTVMAQ